MRDGFAFSLRGAGGAGPRSRLRVRRGFSGSGNDSRVQGERAHRIVSYDSVAEEREEPSGNLLSSFDPTTAVRLLMSLAWGRKEENHRTPFYPPTVP